MLGPTLSARELLSSSNSLLYLRCLGVADCWLLRLGRMKLRLLSALESLGSVLGVI